MEMQYYYIKNSGLTEQLSKFKAVRCKNEFGNYVYYPLIVGTDNDAFISGIGWIKLAKRKVYDIPVYDGQSEHWDSYLEKYGHRCLYYSIAGRDLCCFDAAQTSMKDEFEAINSVGAIGYPQYVKKFKRINDIQMEVLHSVSKYVVEKLLFRPDFRLLKSTVLLPDTLSDDEKLEVAYRRLNFNKKFKEHKEYSEYIRLERISNDYEEELRKKYGNDYSNVCGIKEFGLMKQYSSEAGNKYTEIFKDVDNEITDNIKNGVELPIAMNERIAYIYGEECEKLYSELLK